jgi:ABC-type amino acid transport substrate-binding protein
MITKSKIFVVVILFVVMGILVLRVVDQHTERNRMAAERMTIRYGSLMVGVAVGDTPYGIYATEFGITVVNEIAARLGLRPAFFDTPWQVIFAELDSGIYDIILPSVPLTPQHQISHNFSKPYKAYDGHLFAIALSIEANRLTEVINGALENMFADGTMQRLSMNAFGEDFVTQARQAW